MGPNANETKNQHPQHLSAQILLLTMRLPPVQVQIVNSGTFEAADFTDIGLYLVMHSHDVLCKLGFLWESFAAILALI